MNYAQHAQTVQLKERLLEEIKHIMALGDLTWEDVESVVPRRKSKADLLKSLAGAWEDKDIDALAYQHEIREELETRS